MTSTNEKIINARSEDWNPPMYLSRIMVDTCEDCKREVNIESMFTEIETGKELCAECVTKRIHGKELD